MHVLLYDNAVDGIVIFYVLLLFIISLFCLLIFNLVFDSPCYGIDFTLITKLIIMYSFYITCTITMWIHRISKKKIK